MTSPKNAVSLLTAAALVVAPVGGVAATYDTGYADDGGDKGKDEDGSLAIPDSAEQAIEWIQSGKLTKEAALDKAWADGKIADVDIDNLRQYLKDYLAAVAEAKAEAEAEAARQAEREAAEKAEAKAEAEREAAEKAEAEAQKKAEAEKAAAEEAAKAEAAGADDDAEAAEAQFPQVKEYTLSNDFAGPNGYLLSTVESELVNAKAFTKDELETGGYKVVTTIDKALQDRIQEVGDERPEGMPETLQVGGIAVDQKTGSVKAMYAGSDYLKQQLNNTTQSTFQPGSTMKPFGLIGAAQSDVSFATLFNGNSPEEFETTPGTFAEVPNALGISWGNINLNQATANSVNTVFMNVNEHLTPERYAQIAHDAGISGDIQTDTLYNILGINSLTVWDLAQGHSTIANNGTKNTLHVVDRVLKGDKDMYQPNLNTTKVFEENDCALVQHAMLGTTQYGTAAGVASALGRPVAGKSGTANDETAASFVGYTPQLMNVWAIWNPGPNGENQVVPQFAGYGVSSTGYPSHLFSEFMSTAVADMPVEQFPDAIDNGVIGGPDGDWGLGGSKRGSGNSYNNLQPTQPTPTPTPSESSSSPSNSPSPSTEQQQTPEQTTPTEPSGGNTPEPEPKPSQSTPAPQPSESPAETPGGGGESGGNTQENKP